MKRRTTKESTVFARSFKDKRRELRITQSELAQRAGVGLRFIRDVEQGKKSIRLDTVNQVLALFGDQAAPARIEKDR